MDDSGYVQSSKKECLHFLSFNIYCEKFFSQIPHGLMRKKRKRSKTRGEEGGRFDLHLPVFSRNTKNEGKKSPRSMIYMLLTHCAKWGRD